MSGSPEDHRHLPQDEQRRSIQSTFRDGRPKAGDDTRRGATWDCSTDLLAGKHRDQDHRDARHGHQEADERRYECGGSQLVDLTPAQRPIRQHAGEAMRQRKSRGRHGESGQQQQDSEDQLAVLSPRDVSGIRPGTRATDGSTRLEILGILQSWGPVHGFLVIPG